MTLSMYQASVPVLLRQLGVLSALLTKGAEFAAANGLSEEDLLASRLAPDMHPLTRQVQIASDAAKGVGRLAGAEIPSFPDEEKTLEDLQQRIRKTIAFIEGIAPEGFEGSEERTIVLPIGPDKKIEFAGQTYLLHFALPNFFFHVTTAYAILRHKGVPVGKLDYLGGI